jgi:catabolite regulation protein CreA
LNISMIAMRAVAFILVSLLALTIPTYAQTLIAINTNFRWLGPDDKIIIERYDDPNVAKRVLLYVARRDRRRDGWSWAGRRPEAVPSRAERQVIHINAKSDSANPGEFGHDYIGSACLHRTAAAARPQLAS